MRVFDILNDPHKGKHIHVTRYVKTTSGLDIKIEHNVPSAGTNLQWVQIVSSNSGFFEFCKLLTYVDPFGVGGPVNTTPLPSMPGVCKADDLLPFYWTAADLAGGSGPGLTDKPSRPTPSKGRTWVQFITALTEVTGQSIRALVTIAWGFDRMADGSVRVAVVRRASKDDMASYFKALKLMYPSFTYA